MKEGNLPPPKGDEVYNTLHIVDVVTNEGVVQELVYAYDENEARRVVRNHYIENEGALGFPIEVRARKVLYSNKEQ